MGEGVTGRTEMPGQVTFGIDLGGTSTRVGLYGDGMQLLGSCSMPTRVSAGPQSCVQEMAESIRALGQNSLNGAEVLGVGIGSPGPINLQTGVLGLLPNLPGWENFPLRDALAKATGLPVILESDANAAGIAEWKLGAGGDAAFDSMAIITLGTGVGSGIILNGKVWQGRFGMGGEVGHATVDPNGLLCGCGSRGCLEMYASANGLIRLAEMVVGEGLASDALNALVRAGTGFTPLDVALLAAHDASAREVFRRLGHFLGIGLSNLINTLDLPLVIIGGGLASSWKLFAPAMFLAVRDYSVVYRLAQPLQVAVSEPEKIYICPAQLGPAAGLLGAGMLPWLAYQQLESPAFSLSHR